MTHQIRNYTKTYTWEPMNIFDEQALMLICDHFNQTTDCLRATSRNRSKVFARFLAAKYMRDVCGWSLKAIGLYMNKHHSTIIHYLREGVILMGQYDEIDEVYQRVIDLKKRS